VTLANWRAQRVVHYALRDWSRLPALSGGAGRVALVDMASLDRHAIPAELLADLEGSANHSPIAATWVDGAPISFCYAGTMTETLWDVALETLEPHRGQGHATSCVTFMIHLMRAAGREPAWGALETNRASRRLAAKLGFDRV
jgi:RimJ/RimL family protein N-acetyltransferase